jgi:hypothetical protein
MKKLVVLTLIVAALVGADVSAKAFAQTKLQERARQSLPGADVSAHIRSFPFLPRILLNGHVSEVDFTVRGVEAGGLNLTTVDVDLSGVQLDRDLLLKKRKAELVGISQGVVAVDLTAAQLSDAIHHTVRIAAGQVSVSVGGRYLDAALTGSNSAIVVRVAGLGPLVVPVPRADLVPCLANVTVLSGRVRASCAIDKIPPALFTAVNAANSAR